MRKKQRHENSIIDIYSNITDERVLSVFENGTFEVFSHEPEDMADLARHIHHLIVENRELKMALLEIKRRLTTGHSN